MWTGLVCNPKYRCSLLSPLNFFGYSLVEFFFTYTLFWSLCANDNGKQKDLVPTLLSWGKAFCYPWFNQVIRHWFGFYTGHFSLSTQTNGRWSWKQKNPLMLGIWDNVGLASCFLGASRNLGILSPNWIEGNLVFCSILFKLGSGHPWLCWIASTNLYYFTSTCNTFQQCFMYMLW